MRRFVFIFLLFGAVKSYSQILSTNVIQTAVPFLEVNNDGRIGAFGEIGCVASPFYHDAGLSQNPALLSRGQKYAGIKFSRMSWLESISDDIYFTGIKGFFALDTLNSFGYNFTYFSYPQVFFVNENNDVTGTTKPEEYYHQFSYSRTLNKSWSVGIAVKYIRSDLGNAYNIVTTQVYKPVNSYSIDLGFNYSHSYNISNDKLINLNIGSSITNFGPKVTYIDNPTTEKAFIPTSLKIGILSGPEFRLPEGIKLNIDLAYQADKLLVPTPPLYSNSGNILKGKDPKISPFKALYQSFYDAPGGFKEEMHEIIHKFGGEIRSSYSDIMYFAFRVGRFMEHESKGNRKYNTIGFGIGLYGFTVDYRNSSTNNIYYGDNRIFEIGFKTNLNGKLFRF